MRSSTDGQIGDIQEVEMDHKARQGSVRETRGSSHAGATKDNKTKSNNSLRVSSIKGERTGLRRTQRKNAAQRYKLGKIAAAEENRMIGAELRSERRRSTEGVGKSKIPGVKKSKVTPKSSNNSPVNGMGDDMIYTENDNKKENVNGPSAQQVADVMNVNTLHVQDKSDLPSSNPQAADDDRDLSEHKRLSAESDMKPLNLAASSNCRERPQTGDPEHKPLLPPSEDDGNSSSDQAASFSDSAQHDAGLDDCGGEVSGDWGCADATSEEVKTESVRSDSPSGERRETVAGTDGETNSNKRPGRLTSDTCTVADPNWVKVRDDILAAWPRGI